MTRTTKKAAAADEPTSLVKTRTVKDDDGNWTMECECGFVSSRWPTRTAANERGTQHTTEHETGEPAPPPVLPGGND